MTGDPFRELLLAAQPALAAIELAPVERDGSHAILIVQPPGEAPRARLMTHDEMVQCVPALASDLADFRGDGTRVAVIVVLPCEFLVAAIDVPSAPLKVLH